MGGSILCPRQDVDQEDWHSINRWMDTVIEKLDSIPIESRMDYLVVDNTDDGFNRNRPFMATLKVNRMKKK